MRPPASNLNRLSPCCQPGRRPAGTVNASDKKALHIETYNMFSLGVVSNGLSASAGSKNCRCSDVERSGCALACQAAAPAEITCCRAAFALGSFGSCPNVGSSTCRCSGSCLQSGWHAKRMCRSPSAAPSGAGRCWCGGGGRRSPWRPPFKYASTHVSLACHVVGHDCEQSAHVFLTPLDTAVPLRRAPAASTAVAAIASPCKQKTQPSLCAQATAPLQLYDTWVTRDAAGNYARKLPPYLLEPTGVEPPGSPLL